MLLLLSILILLAGGLMLLFPEMWFELTQSWKSYSAAEPSDLYKLTCRIGGGLYILAGIAGIVVFFVV